MSCKYCYQETRPNGDPIFNDDGTPSIWCDIDCLPIRGRLQRLVYSKIYDNTTISEIVRRLQAEDSSIAQGNISRALSNLKKLGYIKEGQDVGGLRVFTRANALENGEVDDCAYTLEKLNPETKMLRHMLFWLVSSRTPDGAHNQCSIVDSDLVYLAQIVLTECDDGSSDYWNFAEIYTYMEPVVKKLRYIVSEMNGKRVPMSESIGKVENIANWQTYKITALRKAKQGNKGWVAYQPYFAEEWERLCSSGEVHPDAKRYGINEIERNVRDEETARRMSGSA